MGTDTTPRGKMIGMMYLVLTALLALNMSKDILNAFTLINEGLEGTTENFAKKNSFIYAAFEKAAAENAAKAGAWNDKAKEVKKRAAELFNYIQERKDTMIRAVDGLPPDFDLAKKYNADTRLPDENGEFYYKMMAGKDDTNVGPLIMLNRGGAERLKTQIISFKEYLLTLIEAKDEFLKESVEKTLATNDPPADPDHPATWATELFEHVPIIVSIVHMSNIQNNIRNAEAEIIAYLQTKIDAASFKFNKLEANVLSNSNYIIQGGEYNAQIFLAASDTTAPPQVFIGDFDPNTLEMKGELGRDYQELTIENGKGIYKISPSREGVTKWKGIIQTVAPDKRIIKFPFEREYMVAKPSLTVAATKMNVLYIGVDNPISISAPGVPAESLKPSISSGSLSKNSEGYVARVESGAKSATISVSAEIEGENKALGKMDFRVKRVPDPVAYLGKNKGAFNLNKNELLAQSSIIPVLENFDFDLKFTIIGFEMSTLAGGFVVTEVSNDNKVTDAMKNIWGKLNKGSKIYLEKIKAKGPDGSVRELGSVSIKII
jgi:gliding motility-associated protein GldM